MGVDMNDSTEQLERIPSTTLEMLRGILVKSLSRENLSLTDQQKLLATRKDRHVSFEVGKDCVLMFEIEYYNAMVNRKLQLCFK